MRGLRIPATRTASFVLAAASLAACDASPTHDRAASEPDSPGEIVVRPVSVDVMEMSVEEHPLPESLRGDPDLEVASLMGVGTLVGGRGGLFELSGDGFEPIATAPVLDLAEAGSAGIAVVSTEGLAVWNGTLESSPLTGALSGARIRAIAVRGSEVWLGTDQDLFLLDEDLLSSFSGVRGVSSIATFEGARDIVFGTDEGAFTVLQATVDGYITRSLTDEIAASRAVPEKNGRIIALGDGVLRARLPLSEERAVWRRIALTQDSTDEGATLIEMIALDPLAGSVWAFSSSKLWRLDGDRVAEVKVAPGMGTLLAASVTSDGSLWISDGTVLRRFGGRAVPITYEANVAAFSRDNCERCHREGGIARSLTTYEAWLENIDLAVLTLEERRMPLDGAPLVGGTVELLKEWRANGLVR